jgi:DNA polymerase I
MLAIPGCFNYALTGSFPHTIFSCPNRFSNICFGKRDRPPWYDMFHLPRGLARVIHIAMKKLDHLFLVDGSGYIFRAYHALPPLTRKSDGTPVGAVSGFCNMLWKLVKEARDTSVGVTPTHFAVIFDYSSKTFRNDLYPQYKANRTAPPEDLIPQFGLIRQATKAFDLPCIEMQGFEADDLIASYTREALAAGGDVTIISSDKDLMQLVGPRVTLYDTMKDKRLGISDVIEKWGVPPEKMIDLQSLTGDSTDNVPGVHSFPVLVKSSRKSAVRAFSTISTTSACPANWSR